MLRRYLPYFSLLAVVVGFLGVGLTLNPRELPSPLIDHQAPRFRLPQLHDAGQIVTPDDMVGRVWLFNVWASWCTACRQEHPLLLELAKTGLVPIYGLDYKDQRANGLEWLHEAGDPYMLSVSDLDGRVGIDFGVYGVPETFVIDKKGFVRYKQVGPLTPNILQSRILPLVKELNG
jgi:cytochrome c biogenesis protein CcmG/thiol:disulfide interchange protein DsbE